MKHLSISADFQNMLRNHNVNITWADPNFKDDFSFSLADENGDWDDIFFIYSSFYNATTFCGNCGDIIFRVLHTEKELYVYSGSNTVRIKDSTHHQLEQSEWDDHVTKGIAIKRELNESNLMSIFESIFIQMKKYEGD